MGEEQKFGTKCVTFWNKHKKKVIIAGEVAVVLFAGLGLYKILSGGEIPKYSKKWFETVSDKELSEERERIVQQLWSAGDDFAAAVRYQNMINIFDNVKGERDWAGCIEYEFPAYSGHGPYLLDKD